MLSPFVVVHGIGSSGWTTSSRLTDSRRSGGKVTEQAKAAAGPNGYTGIGAISRDGITMALACPDGTSSLSPLDEYK
jgi:hypothetical protein